MLDEWYSYGEFQFKREQVLWALRHAVLFREGKWPCQNIISGYTDPGIRTQRVKKEPAFVKPAIVMAETEGVEGVEVHIGSGPWRSLCQLGIGGSIAGQKE